MVSELTYEFGVRETPKGCVVWQKSPNGHVIERRFRSTIYCSASEKSKQWVHSQKMFLAGVAEEGGVVLRFAVPPALKMSAVDVRVSVSEETFERWEGQAKADGLSLSAWVVFMCNR